MKIAIFSETYPPYINGVASHVYMLKKTLEELGHEVMVVTVGSEKQDEIIIKDNVVYVPGHLLKMIYNYRVANPMNPEYKRPAINFEPDVIHIQNEFGIGYIGLKVAKERNLPIVYTLHSEYDEYMFYVGLKYFKSFSQSLSAKYFRRFSKNADVITSPSTKAQNYIDRQKVNKRVCIIDNAVEFERFQPNLENQGFRQYFRAKYNLTDETKAFVFVGRIGKEKNISELIDNWIYSNLPKEKAKLFIIGKGPNTPELEQKIKENNFEDSIILLGSVPNTDIGNYLHAMDYYTTASISEMHSISMLEAMASGLPALIKLDKPNENQIKPGINGYQWDTKEDFKELFEKIINFTKEEDYEFKQKVLKYSKENDHYNQTNKIIELYKKAIEIRAIKNQMEEK